MKSGKKLSSSVAELISSGRWTTTENGWTIYNFLKWNPSGRDVEERRRNRSNAGKRGGLSSGQARQNRSKTEASASPIVHVCFALSPDMVEANVNPVPVPVPVPKEQNTNPPYPPALAAPPLNSQTPNDSRISEKSPNEGIHDKCRKLLEKPHEADWAQPNKWPEVVDLAEKFSAKLGWHKPAFPKTDKRVMRMVELLATFDGPQLAKAVANAGNDDWLSTGSKGLLALTNEVVGRLLNPKRQNSLGNKRQPDYAGENGFVLDPKAEFHATGTGEPRKSFKMSDFSIGKDVK
jgi:hypothetical protein